MIDFCGPCMRREGDSSCPLLLVWWWPEVGDGSGPGGCQAQAASGISAPVPVVLISSNLNLKFSVTSETLHHDSDAVWKRQSHHWQEPANVLRRILLLLVLISLTTSCTLLRSSSTSIPTSTAERNYLSSSCRSASIMIIFEPWVRR